MKYQHFGPQEKILPTSICGKKSSKVVARILFFVAKYPTERPLS